MNSQKNLLIPRPFTLLRIFWKCWGLTVPLLVLNSANPIHPCPFWHQVRASYMVSMVTVSLKRALTTTTPRPSLAINRRHSRHLPPLARPPRPRRAAWRHDDASLATTPCHSQVGKNWLMETYEGIFIAATVLNIENTRTEFDGLVQETRNSIANALELLLSCTNLSR